ncbi:hypothetical protein EDB80DRAFT_814485 [Ilyonectria destructans]|nr:hypothetical protein EDB80DRAFT_814485 [Ilyonectria destructans]
MGSNTDYERFPPRDQPSHSRLPSRIFSVPWVGDRPNLGQRRRYMHAYLDWMVPVPDFRAAIDQLRREAEVQVADRLVSEGVETIQAKTFEFSVDRLIWERWFSSLDEAPCWPSVSEPHPEPEEPTSKRFDELRLKSLAAREKGIKAPEKPSKSPRLPAAPNARNPFQVFPTKYCEHAGLFGLGNPYVDTVGQERILKQHQACTAAVNSILDTNDVVDDVKNALDRWLLAPRGAPGLSRNTHIMLAEGVWNARMARSQSLRNHVAEWADSARSTTGK